jgi:DNA modification methylase
MARKQTAPKRPGLKVEEVPLSSLKPMKGNPRKNEAAIPKIASSLERFGWTNPVLARRQDRVIIAGHTRVEAAKRIGLTKVPVIWLDLSPNDAKLYALADNRLAEIAEWDNDGLALILRELQAEDANLAEAGFDDDEVSRILGEVDADRLGDVDEAEDAVTDPPKKPESITGEVYELGPHRLKCGDSTSVDDVEDALGARQADLLFTDPPYGISYVSHWAKGGTASRFAPIENDDLDPAKLQQFLTDAFSAAAAGVRNGWGAYICHANGKPGLAAAFERAMLDTGWYIASVLVWVKPAATMGWQDYRSRYEPILYGWRVGAERRKVEDRTETNVWEIKRDAAQNYVHPTQKPVELPMRAIRNSTVAGETVLDLFGGSGSTLIACAKTGRKAVLVEKDPGYCDVIRRRWAKWQETAGNRG